MRTCDWRRADGERCGEPYADHPWGDRDWRADDAAGWTDEDHPPTREIRVEGVVFHDRWPWEFEREVALTRLATLLRWRMVEEFTRFDRLHGQMTALDRAILVEQRAPAYMLPPREHATRQCPMCWWLHEMVELRPGFDYILIA